MKKTIFVVATVAVAAHQAQVPLIEIERLLANSEPLAQLRMYEMQAMPDGNHSAEATSPIIAPWAGVQVTTSPLHLTWA
jgi:hypothetical protein